MRIGKCLRKCSALLLALAMVFNVMSPTLAAITTPELDEAGYLALGDAMSLGTGLEYPEQEAYYVLVAQALAAAGLIDGEDDYRIKADKRYRVEEIRYLMDDSYNGDGYTRSVVGEMERNTATVRRWIAGAEVITINAGVNNFSTYIVEQMMHYLENDGEVKYSYSFDAFFEEDVQSALEKVKATIKNLMLSAANDDVDVAIELIDFIAEVSTYAVLSYVTSFNAMVSTIYELNPDVELYIVGIYNPAEGEVLTYDKLSKGGRPIELPVGDFFGGLVEIANAYVQVLAPRAYNYTYVDPGAPELLIDQMGNTKLTDNERIPEGLIMELVNLSGDAAVNEVIDIFAEYGISKTQIEALGFLEELIEAKENGTEKEFIKSELQGYVIAEIEDQFQRELLEYLGQFADEENEVIDPEDISDLLADLEAAADEAARQQVAEDFVDSLIEDETLQNQAAAKVIYGYIEDYELSGYVTVENVEQLIEDLRACGAEAEREDVANKWVRELAADKIVEKVESIVGEGTYSKDKAIAMLLAMEASNNPGAVAREKLIKDIFHNYIVSKVEESYNSNGLNIATYSSVDAFVTAIETAPNGEAAEDIVRNEIRAAAAAKAMEYNNGFLETAFGTAVSSGVINELFLSMDNATDKNAALKTWLDDLFVANDWDNLIGTPIYSDLIANFNDAYESYSDAAKSSIDAVKLYLESVDTAAEACADFVVIKETTVAEILKVYNENCDADGKLNVGNFGNFDELRETAISKILEGYDKYVEAIDLAMSSADTINEYLDPVYEMLKDLAEIEVISLNDIISVGKKVVTGGQSYIHDMVDNLLVNQTLEDDEMTVAYLALRYYLADGMMIMPSANGHQYIANRIVAAINGEDMESTAGSLANSLIDKVVNGAKDIYHITKKYLSLPTTGSGQAATIINPEAFVALGDNVTSGTALNSGDKTYVDMLADALAMEYKDIANYDNDKINNLAINGMRTEELLAIVSNNYSGDAYTDAKFNIAGIKAQYQAAIVDAELITLEVGINNLVTYPMTQALLAYNGEDIYEMDWTQYFSTRNVARFEKGKDVAMDMLLYLVDNADSRLEDETGISAYDECKRALETFFVAVESFAYGCIGYVANLDAAVETIAEMNKDATIVLVGFYNPLEDTYVKVNKVVEVKGHTVDLSKFVINTSAITELVVKESNRFLTNFVGDYAGNDTAADSGSRIVTVAIPDTELCISDTDANKNLVDLTDWKTVSVHGKPITIKVPEYLYETLATGGSALHPNATGHAYISQQILKALDYEIHADVIVDDDWKYYGDADPEFTYTMDDESSLYDILVEFQRVQGENVGKYTIFADVTENSGYYEVDVETGVFEIVARPINIKVIVENGVIKDVEFDDDVLAREGVDVLNLQYADGEVTYDNDNYDVTIVVDETNGTIVYNGSTLSLEAEVFINSYFKVTGFDGVDMSTNSGMLIWYSEPNLEDAVITNADAINKVGLVLSENASWGWGGQTDGFDAAEFADEIYIRGYVKVGDNYYYSELKEFSVQDYCESVIARNNNPALVDTCIALLHYGTAAQINFNHNTDDLANASIVAQYPPEEWNADLLTDLVAADTNITGDAEVVHIGKTLSLDAATEINYYFTFSGEATVHELLVWDGVSGQLTTGNVSYTVDMDLEDNGRYKGKSDIYPAALYSKTIYACAYFVDAEGNEYYSDVIAFSPEEYTRVVIDRNSGGDLAEACRRMVIYGEYARIYFGK